jgi:hypothetical protein
MGGCGGNLLSSKINSGITQKWRHIEDSTVTSGYGFFILSAWQYWFCLSAKKLYWFQKMTPFKTPLHPVSVEQHIRFASLSKFFP